MNPYMSYTPYMPQDAYMQDQMALRQRIDNLSQAQQQYKAQTQPKYFLKIIENQNKIISMLEESISTKK